MTSILILGETTEAKTLDPVTGELIAAGRQIADDIGVALLGTDLEDPVREAIALGASVVYTVEEPALDGPEVDAKIAALTEVSRRIAPRVLLVVGV